MVKDEKWISVLRLAKFSLPFRVSCGTSNGKREFDFVQLMQLRSPSEVVDNISECCFIRCSSSVETDQSGFGEYLEGGIVNVLDKYGRVESLSSLFWKEHLGRSDIIVHLFDRELPW